LKEEMMDDFTLAFQPVPDGYLVNAECRLIGQTRIHLSTERQRDLEKLSERLRARPLREITETVEVGRHLFCQIFQEKVARCLRTALRYAEEEGGVRLLLRFGPEDPLQELPWELLHDGTCFLAMNPMTPIARCFAMERPVRRPRWNRPVRVLFTSACPAGTPDLDLAGEERRIHEALDSLTDVKLVTKNQISLPKLRHCLLFAEKQHRPFQVWHHGGHGSSGTEFNLCFEGDAGGQQVGNEEVAGIVKDCPSLIAVVLNVCHGAALATALACQNLPVVVGFQERIQDRAALVFAKHFYKNLCQSPVEIALTRARLALAFQGCPPLGWTSPVLYTRASQAVVLGEEH
jgi:CHAT domain-containing protein